MEEDEITEEEHDQEEKLQQEGENFGFVPMEDDLPKPVEVKVVTPEMLAVKDKILQLLSRYPELSPRSSSAIAETLSQYDLGALNNIYNNCLNDLQIVRGTPSAELVIYLLAGSIDARFIPGYLEVCLDDIELQRDIESEMFSLLHWFGNKVNIAFRLINNAYKTIHGIRQENKPDVSSKKSKYVHELDEDGKEREDDNPKSSKKRKLSKNDQ